MSWGATQYDYLTLQGINAKIVPQSSKHRYIYFWTNLTGTGWRYRACRIQKRSAGYRWKSLNYQSKFLKKPTWNVNQIDEAMLQRLRMSIGKYGLVQILSSGKLAMGTKYFQETKG